MRFRWAATGLALLLAAGPVASQELIPEFPRAPARTDRFIVQFKPSALDGHSQALQADPATDPAGLREQAWLQVRERARGLAQRHGLAVRDIRGIGPDMVVVALDESTGDTLARRLQSLQGDSAVVFVEPDHRRVAHAVPSDPLFGNQWYFQSAQPSGVRLDAGWDEATGHPDTVIAVLDTGIRFEHPDLKRVSEGGVLLDGYDFVSGEGGGSFLTANDGSGWDPDPSDPGDWLTTEELLSDDFGPACGDPNDPPPRSSWHGTRVAGMVGALASNGLGITGGTWQGAILPVRVLGKCGGYDSDIIAAMRWSAGLPVPGRPDLVNPTPAQVLNLSLGSETSCSNSYRTVMSELTAAGVLVVASAGNENGPVNAPANCPGVLAVAGLRHVGTKVGYSSFGSQVEVAAPAGNCVDEPPNPCLFSLVTTSNSGLTTPGSSIYTDEFNRSLGTSFSAPIVAAIAGLMRGVNDSLTPGELTARIQASARPFPRDSGLPTCPTTSNGFYTAGQCNCTTSTCGAGMADGAGAIAEARRPIARIADLGTVNRGVVLDLDGTTSQAARNRTIASWSWSVVTGTGVTIADATLPSASVLVPESGGLTVRLMVTDDLGLTDAMDVSVVAASSGGGGGGGGGSPDGLLLAVLAALAMARRRQP